MATYTVTNSFSADTTAIASEVNQNFTDVLTALNSFDAANLTGTISLARISNLTYTQMSSAFFKDEDDMASNSATAVSSQQALKAYIDGTSTVGFTPSSYAGEESITFPNGLIIKMGQSSTIGSNVIGTVTFGTAFPTACVQAICYPLTSGLWAHHGGALTAKSTTTLSIHNRDGTTQTFRWLAIGY